MPARFIAASVLAVSATVSVAQDNSDDWTVVHNTVSNDWFEGGMTPPITNVQVSTWTSVLGLSQDQVQILKGLQADAENEFRLGLLEYRERSQDAQARAAIEQDWSLTEAAQRELSNASARLREQIESDVMEQFRLILSGEQEASWPSVEDAERRTRVLSAPSAVPMFGLDVITAVRSTVSDAAALATVEPILESYRTELSPLLTSITSEMETLAEDIQDSERAQREMHERAEEDMNVDWMAIKETQDRANQALADRAMRIHGMCERIASVNRRTLTAVVEAVGGEDGERLQRFADRMKPASSSPSWFGSQTTELYSARSSMAFRTLLPQDETDSDTEEAAMFGGVSFTRMLEFQQRMMVLARDEFPDVAEQWSSFMPVASASLTDDQVNTLRGLRESFKEASDRIESRYTRTLRPLETERDRNRLVVPAGTGAVYLARGGAAEDPWGKSDGETESRDESALNEYREQMLDLDQQTLDEIRRLLTPEQRLALLSF